MTRQVAAELLKLRTTRTLAGLAAAAVGLVAAAVLLHGYGLGVERLASSDDQLTLLVGWGAVLGGLFAGLCGALSFTAEVRHGTIRPTLLVTPRRHLVIAAKGVAVAIAGAFIAVAATAAAAVTGEAALAARGMDSALGMADYLLFVAGGAVSGAIWSVIGLGVGAATRSQVPAVVGILAWVLFVEGQLLANAQWLGRLAPGPLGQAVSGLDPGRLLDPLPAALALAVYGALAGALGWLATSHRDFA